MRYAPNDAPYTGKGRWTWPIAQIEDPKTIKKIINRGIQLQDQINDLKNEGTDRDINNPQLLWETFKNEIKKIAKHENRKTYHKMTSKIRNIEKDRAELVERSVFVCARACLRMQSHSFLLCQIPSCFSSLALASFLDSTSTFL
jgi:hypothetical protein